MYPIKAQNVVEGPPQFQVDHPLQVPDPLLVPDFASTMPDPIERIEMAHIVYNRLRQAELIYRRPVSVGERDGLPVAVTDYSVIETRPAVNQLWSGN